NSFVAGLWDSLMKPLNAANYGISGDRTQHILWGIQNGNIGKVKPRIMVLEIGVNNFKDNTAREIASGIEAIVRTLNKTSPSSKIILFGPLPTGKDNQDPNRQKYYQVHQSIKKLNNGKTVIYLNLDKQFFKPDGTLIDGVMSGDAVHLAKEGYRLWAGVMVPVIKRLRAR
ncbi:MAG: GDSL-type esterase/lipase family protein, partial [Bacteroidales bacterium]|nr:GDSL-type esterase/lipase family protein [Bacteroidales bacterium]